MEGEPRKIFEIELGGKNKGLFFYTKMVKRQLGFKPYDPLERSLQGD